MTDEQFASGVEVESGSDELHDPGPHDVEPDEQEQPTRSRPILAVGRAAAVLVAGAIVYQFVIPSTHYVPARISRLVVADTGLSQFAGKKPQAGIQDATQTGLTSMTSAVKKSPHQTGLYSSQWAASQTSAAVVAAFVLPNAKDAEALQSEFQKQQMAAGSYTADGLTRRSTGSISGIPGGVQSYYASSDKSSGSPNLSVALSRVGRVVGLAEVAGVSGAQADSQSLATKEYTQLTKTVPGFSFSKVDRPVLGTSLWGAGTVLLALLFALAPIGWGRWSRARQRRRDEEMSHQVHVGSQVIYKYRR